MAREVRRLSPPLLISPLSDQIMQAAYASCHEIGFICTIGQCGPEPYTGWTRERLTNRMRVLEQTYGKRIPWFRDHLGKYNKTFERLCCIIDDDVRFGVEGVMIDCEDEKLALQVCAEFPDVRFEFGRGERGFYSFKTIPENAEWVSWPCGMLINGLVNNNSPAFDIVTSRKFRAHNCDYATEEAIKQLRKYAHSIQIAPMLGVLESLIRLKSAMQHGIDYHAWWTACGGDIAKGHYHFDLIPEVDCIPEHLRVINRYAHAFRG